MRIMGALEAALAQLRDADARIVDITKDPDAKYLRQEVRKLVKQLARVMNSVPYW